VKGAHGFHNQKLAQLWQNTSAAMITKETAMSKIIETAVEALSARLSGGFDGVAKFVLPGEGAIMVDGAGVRAGDEPADVTLTASVEVFEQLLAGELSAASAFMSGKLVVDGSMGLAMKLGGVLG
jgi:putative sterol carrier protein